MIGQTSSRAAFLRLVTSSAALLPVLASAGCGGATTSLAATPHSPNAARALARTVAEKAQCDGFEDFNVPRVGPWDFSYQIKEDLFVIHTTAAGGGAASAREPRRVGSHFTVTAATGPTATDPEHSLSTFPGKYEHPAPF